MLHRRFGVLGMQLFATFSASKHNKLRFYQKLLFWFDLTTSYSPNPLLNHQYAFWQTSDGPGHGSWSWLKQGTPDTAGFESLSAEFVSDGGLLSQLYAGHSSGSSM